MGARAPGRVTIANVWTQSQSSYNFHNQVLLAVALHPFYERETMFAVGGTGQQLLLHYVRYFRSENETLHAGEGSIYNIKWRGDLIAWANDRGVKLYDQSTRRPIAYIPRQSKGSPDPELYPCCLCWENDETLLIGWGDWVKIGKIRQVCRTLSALQLWLNSYKRERKVC